MSMMNNGRTSVANSALSAPFTVDRLEAPSEEVLPSAAGPSRPEVVSTDEWDDSYW
jgi:hypothetical protein